MKPGIGDTVLVCNKPGRYRVQDIKDGIATVKKWTVDGNDREDIEEPLENLRLLSTNREPNTKEGWD